MGKILNYLNKNMVVDRDLLFLLLIGGLYSLGIFLSNTFVNIYLWKQSGAYSTIAIYNLAVFLFQGATFVFAGRLAKKVDRIIVLRLGVMFLSLFFLGVLIIGDRASTFNFTLGSLLGIGYGLYWLAFNVLTFEITEPDTRDFFNGFLGVLESLGGMIGPALSGFIIAKATDNIGYNIIFAVSFTLFLLAVGCSFLIKKRPAKGQFHFKLILSERKENPNWKRILHAHFFQGLREGIFLFVISIWVFIVTGSEFSLGMFNLILSGLSFLFYFLTTKFVHAQLRKHSILIGALILYFSIFIILFQVSYPKLLIYAILIGIAYPLINVPYVSLTYDVIGKARYAKELRIEYIVVRELFVNIGRVFSIIVFIISIYLVDAEKVIPYLLLIFGAGHIIIYFYLKHISFTDNLPEEVMVKEQISDEKNR